MVPTLMSGLRMSVLLRVGGPLGFTPTCTDHPPCRRGPKTKSGPATRCRGAHLVGSAQALSTHASRAARTEPQHDDDDDERNMWRSILRPESQLSIVHSQPPVERPDHSAGERAHVHAVNDRLTLPRRQTGDRDDAYHHAPHGEPTSHNYSWSRDRRHHVQLARRIAIARFCRPARSQLAIA